MRTLLLLLGAAGLVLLLAGCANRQEAFLLLTELPEVGSITFQGNHRFDDDELKSVMSLKERTWTAPFRDHRYSERALEADILAVRTLYLRHGYLRARITGRQVRQAGDEVRITIGLEEGEPVLTRSRALLFEDPSGRPVPAPDRLDRDDLLEGTQLVPGAPFDPYRLQDDRRRIVRNLGDRGYLLARVDSDVQFEGNDADLFLSVVPGERYRVGSIAVVDNREIPDRVVRRQLEVEPGDLYRLDRVVRSQRRLIQSGWFSDAQWDTFAVDPGARTVGLRFRMRERRMRAIEAGVGVSSKGLLRVSSGWSTRNLLHRGIGFALNARFDLDIEDRVGSLLDEQRSEALLQFPNVLRTRWEGQPGIFYTHDREPGYTQDIYGIGLTARRRLFDFRDQIVLSVENRWVHNRADSAARAQDPQLVRPTYQTRLFTVRGQLDSRDDFFNPVRGGLREATLELAGGVLGGNNGFRKATAGAAQFVSPREGLVLAGRLQAGTIKAGSVNDDIRGVAVQSEVERIPTEDRYRLGGANTVRGFAQDELDGTVGAEGPSGGLVSLLANLEARWSVFWRFSLVGFLDAGNVWQDRDDLRLDRLWPRSDPAEVTPFDLRYSFGGGLRLATPVGPVRVDYARKWNLPSDRPESKDRWHVSLGHAF